MTADDIAETLRRVEARRGRIEGEVPREFDVMIRRLRSALDRVDLGGRLGHLGRPLVVVLVEPAMGSALAMHLAVARVRWERLNPSMRARMMSGEAIDLALRAIRLELIDA